MSSQNEPTPKSASGHWYTVFPIPEVTATPLTYQFTNPSLEAQVFTHPTFANGTLPNNSVLSFEGATIITTLATLSLTSIFPTHPTSTLTDLRLAITSRSLHAHLSRLLSLPPNLRTAQPETLGSERLQAELFESYIAGIARELTLTRFEELRQYHLQLLEPFIRAYYTLHQSAAHHPTIREKQRKQELATFTMKLMEYAAKNKLEPPVYDFSSISAQGSHVQWSCQVILGGIHVAKAVAGSKSNAKHLASAEAMKALPPMAGERERDGGGHHVQERRRKKEHYRTAAKVRAGQPVFGQPGWVPPAVPMATTPSWGS